MQDRYLLQVCRDKLTDYVMKALICPDALMGEECHIDTQSKHQNVLLLSNGIVKDLDYYEEILVELILTKEEIDVELKRTNSSNIFFFAKPLPISRISKIYTRDVKESAHILKKIETNQKGFIPKHLLEVRTDFEKFEISLEIEKDTDIDTEYNIKVCKFDKMLGMLSYMRNCEYYYTDENKMFSNFSANYFGILNTINKAVESPKNSFLQTLKEDENTGFFQFLMEKNRLDKTFIHNLIEKRTVSKEIKQHLLVLISDPLKKLEILEVLKDKGVYFYICLVYINSDKYSNKMSSFKRMLNRQIPYDKAEKALAYLGLYYGYELLDAKEEIETQNKCLKKFLKDSEFVNTKFLLESRLDYIVIESVYQYVFGKGVTNDSFSYLEDIEVIQHSETVQCGEWYEKRILGRYFDVEYYNIKQRTQREYIEYKVSQYDDEIYANNYISTFYNKYFSESLMPTSIPVKKQELMNKIKSLSAPMQKEILKAIEMDYDNV